MKRLRLAFSGIATAVILICSGCLFVWDRSSHYPDIVGAEFVTRRDGYLFHMHEYQYEFVPFHLESTRDSYGAFADFVEIVPAGSRIKVKEAKFRSNLDAGFDYLIAELYMPGRVSPILIEHMIGSPDEAASISSIWEKVITERPNQAPEPTALLVTPAADAPGAPSKAVAHL